MLQNKKRVGLCLLLLFGLLHLGKSSAAVVGFSPVNQSVALGSAATVDLFVSDLGSDILTGFSLEISYDPSILDFQSFSVGPGPTGLDPFGLFPGLFSFGFELLPPQDDTVSVGDLSSVDDATLKAVQPDSFVLGTLEFDTLAVGTSALTIGFAQLSGEVPFGATFPVDLATDLRPGSIEVSVIPVPAAVWLFGTGLIALFGIGKRKKYFQHIPSSF